jgi:hypothetical protein
MRGEVVVFCGPSLLPHEVRAVLGNARIEPPARRGDVLRAVRVRPAAVALIDGVFDQTPSVWHKEILWAVCERVGIFGAASMGALRAAETHAYGMVGMGRIFEMLAAGELTADDEVAVTHGAAEDAFKPTSEALVNIRMTLRAAEQAQVLTVSTRTALERLAQQTFYPNRHYRSLLADGRAAGLPQAELASLEAWLPAGRIDQKRRDALQLLTHIAALPDDYRPPPPAFAFQQTESWLRLCASVEERSAPPATSGACESDPAQMAGLLRAIAVREAKERGTRLEAAQINLAIDHFRRRAHLLDAAAFEAWLGKSFASDRAALQFFEEEALIHALRERHEHAARLYVRNAALATASLSAVPPSAPPGPDTPLPSSCGDSSGRAAT